MNSERLNRYLDGEAPPESLDATDRLHASAWDELLEEVRAAGAPGAPVGLESRIMRAVREESRASAWTRLRSWWLNPRPLRVRPVAGLAAAAVILAALVVGWTAATGPDGRDNVAVQPPTSEEPTTYVQFLLDAPEANSVAVAGDFNEWATDQSLEDADGDGIWSGRIALPPGVHRYMFVVDGNQWITDPYAGRYAEDGFGNRNAVLAIMGGAGTGALAP